MAKSSIFSTAEGNNAGAFAVKDWLLLAAAAMIFGSSFLLMAEALDFFAPALVTFLRIGFGCALLSLVPASRQRIERNDWPKVVLLGFLWFAVPLSLFPLAQERIDSSVAGMINGATPLITGIVAAVLLQRIPGRNQLLGVGIGLAGMVAIAIPSFSLGSSATAGIGFALGAVTCYGFAFNLAIPLQHRYGALPILWRASAISVLLTALPAVRSLDQSVFSWSALGACVIVGVFGTGVAYVAMAVLSGRVGSTRGSVLVYVATPIAIGLGVLVRNESLDWLAGLGAAITLCGAFLASRADTNRGATAARVRT